MSCRWRRGIANSNCTDAAPAFRVYGASARATCRYACAEVTHLIFSTVARLFQRIMRERALYPHRIIQPRRIEILIGRDYR